MVHGPSQQVFNLFIVVCGAACFIMILIFTNLEESYDRVYRQVTTPEQTPRQNLAASDECSIVHPKLNSCNTLPNYYLYPDRREDFQSAIITFWHIQKAGGSSVERCFEEMQPKLHLPPPLRGGISCEQLKVTFPQLPYFENDSFKPVIQGHYILGHCDFFRDMNIGRKCSTFALFREPYARAVSHYYFLRQIASHETPSEGYLRAVRLPITEWLKLDGSPMWFAFDRIWSAEVTDDGKFKCSMISKNIPGKKWPFNDTRIDEIIDNLDKHLSFVGLLDDMFTTYKMLEEIYNLPFVNQCYGRHFNEGNYENLNATAKLELEREAKRTLMEDKEIRELMKFDVRIYEKAKEIFNAQKEIFFGRRQ